MNILAANRLISIRFGEKLKTFCFVFAMAAGVCRPPCAAEPPLASWQQYPGLIPTEEHVIHSGTRRFGKDKLSFEEGTGSVIYPQLVPQTAGLGATLRLPPKALPGLVIGKEITHGNSFREIFRKGTVITAHPVEPAWNAGGFGSPAISRLIPMPDSDPEECGDWTHHKTFYTGELEADEAALMGDEESSLSVTLSRLCPGVLFDTNTGGMSFFQGLPPYAKSIPFAVRTDDNVEILELEIEQEIALPPSKWVLLFWGAIPPQRYDFAWAANTPVAQDRPPVLFVFSEPPISISNGDNISFRFAEQSVKTVMFPLSGVDFPKGDETEKWKSGLPPEIAARCDLWSGRLAMFPVIASETYSYNAADDTVECETRMGYERVGENGTPWTPLPPMLMLACDKLPLSFDPAPATDVYRTAYGPLIVVDGTDTVKWRFSGLAPHVFGRPALGPSNAQSRELERELERELDKIFAVPYLAPWVYETRRFGAMSEVYWRQPWETAYYLAQAMPVLDNAYREKLAGYIDAFQEFFPFLELPALPTWKGPKRTRYYTGVDEEGNNEALPEQDYKYYETMNDPGAIAFNVVRGLDEYYEATGKQPDAETWKKAAEMLEDSLMGADWASGLWTQGHAPEIPPAARSHKMDFEFPARCLQRHLGCLVGFLRMSRRCNMENTDATNLAWGRLARGLATRAGLAGYGAWLRPPFGLIDYTDARAHEPPGTHKNKPGNAVWLMNQFAVHLQDSSAVVHRKSVYMDYLDLTPEVGRFLRDHCRERISDFLDAVDRGWPLWWTANMTSELGADSSAGLQQPMNSHSLFMAGAWIRGDSGEKLLKRLDFPWTERGDLYYIHKLSETIKALRGIQWTVPVLDMTD